MPSEKASLDQTISMRSCIRRQSAFLRDQGRFSTSRRAFLQEISHPGSSFGRQQSSVSSENGEGATESSLLDNKSIDLTGPDSIMPILGRKVPPGIKVASAPSQPLPASPEAPPYPCQHLTKAEFNQYLKPLYERGWGIHIRPPRDDVPTTTFMLAKNIKFIWNFALVEFLAKLHPVVHKLRHHPRVSYEQRALDIMMQTHSAYANDKTQSMPGITLRDIQLAYAVEEILSHFYNTSKIEQQPPKYPRIFALTMNNLTPRKDAPNRPSKCIVCNGDHWASVCPSRFTVKPPVPCELCGGDHWKFTCPQFSQWKAMIKHKRAKQPLDTQFQE